MYSNGSGLSYQHAPAPDFRFRIRFEWARLLILSVLFLRIYFIPTRCHHGWMKGFLAFSVLLILLYGIPAFADLDKGWDAYRSGDYSTAFKEWSPLAEQGMTDAQFNIGWMYDNGIGVKKSYKTALKWYRLAAENEHADAQYILALMYQKGRGTTRDSRAAVKFLEKAVQQDHTKAQFILGLMYYEGQGVTRDYEAAIRLFKPAAERGHATAQYNLGYMYQRGYGVAQNYSRAYMWLSKSASQGIRIAAVNRDVVENEMTPSQIKKAEDLARECEVKNYKDC